MGLQGWMGLEKLLATQVAHSNKITSSLVKGLLIKFI